MSFISEVPALFFTVPLKLSVDSLPTLRAGLAARAAPPSTIEIDFTKTLLAAAFEAA